MRFWSCTITTVTSRLAFAPRWAMSALPAPFSGKTAVRDSCVRAFRTTTKSVSFGFGRGCHEGRLLPCCGPAQAAEVWRRSGLPRRQPWSGRPHWRTPPLRVARSLASCHRGSKRGALNCLGQLRPAVRGRDGSPHHAVGVVSGVGVRHGDGRGVGPIARFAGGRHSQ